jgi:hypothetical protein
MTNKQLADVINAAINAGAEIGMKAAGVSQDKIASVFLNNISFSQARNAKRVELVKQNEKKLKKE